MEIIVKEGYPYVGVSGGIFLISLIFRFPLIWQLIFFGIFMFMIYFFRNPPREPEEEGENVIISPADGVVLEICEAISPITNEKSIKVSIRLSLIDLHIQFSPIEGEMSAREYIHGTFLALNSNKASELNEQNRVLFKNQKGKVVVNQIAGFITRRIVMFRDLGFIKLAKKYGMITFGSQVDIYLPLDSKIKVIEFQKLKGGESVIGYFND